MGIGIPRPVSANHLGACVNVRPPFRLQLRKVFHRPRVVEGGGKDRRRATPRRLAEQPGVVDRPGPTTWVVPVVIAID